MVNYWISWHQPTEDNRPLTYPPNEGILGWWCIGRGGEGENGYWTLCAMVRAKNKKQAEKAIFKDWPEAKDNTGLDGDWRIFREATTLKLGDRFPLKGWMKERFENLTGTEKIMKKKAPPKTKKPSYTISYIQGGQYIHCHKCDKRSFSSDHIKSKVCSNCGHKHKD